MVKYIILENDRLMDIKNFSSLIKAKKYVKRLSKNYPQSSFTLTRMIIKYL